jgi:CelD/BcsL family acetyltransferase involved in cellulose biosynthesis
LGVAEHKLGVVRSFLADLKVDPLGYDHYLLKNSYTVSRQPQKTRRMIRELGPLKFDFDCCDASLLEYLIRIKCEQYSRTHNFQILGVPWIGAMMLDLLYQRDSTVRGVLSVMSCGEKPIAMHFGMA